MTQKYVAIKTSNNPAGSCLVTGLKLLFIYLGVMAIIFLAAFPGLAFHLLFGF